MVEFPEKRAEGRVGWVLTEIADHRSDEGRREDLGIWGRTGSGLCLGVVVNVKRLGNLKKYGGSGWGIKVKWWNRRLTVQMLLTVLVEGYLIERDVLGGTSRRPIPTQRIYQLTCFHDSSLHLIAVGNGSTCGSRSAGRLPLRIVKIKQVSPWKKRNVFP